MFKCVCVFLPCITLLFCWQHCVIFTFNYWLLHLGLMISESKPEQLWKIHHFSQTARILFYELCFDNSIVLMCIYCFTPLKGNYFYISFRFLGETKWVISKCYKITVTKTNKFSNEYLHVLIYSLK